MLLHSRQAPRRLTFFQLASTTRKDSYPQSYDIAPETKKSSVAFPDQTSTSEILNPIVPPSNEVVADETTLRSSVPLSDETSAPDKVSINSCQMPIYACELLTNNFNFACHFRSKTPEKELTFI